MKKKETISEKIEKGKKNIAKMKAFNELCYELFDSFDHEGELMVAIDKASPWEHVIYNDEVKFEVDRMLDVISDAMKVSFAFGYVIGQGLDVSEIETKPILDFLREKKTLFHFPHEKKAA